MDYEKTCPVCSKKYTAKRRDSKVCSDTCRVKLHLQKRAEKAELAGIEKGIEQAVNQMYIDGNGKEWPSKEAWLADLKERMRKKAENLSLDD